MNAKMIHAKIMKQASLNNDEDQKANAMEEMQQERGAMKIWRMRGRVWRMNVVSSSEYLDGHHEQARDAIRQK